MKPSPLQVTLTFEVQLLPVEKPKAEAEVPPKIEKAEVTQKNIVKSEAQPEVSPVAKPAKSLPKPAFVENNMQADKFIADLPKPFEENADKITRKKIDSPTVTSKISTENLLASAHHIAKEDALAMPKEKGDSIALADREFSPKLAYSMNKNKILAAGTYPIGNGQIKVVNADGSEYCLKPPPDSAMPAGAFDANVSNPMTCP